MTSSGLSSDLQSATDKVSSDISEMESDIKSGVSNMESGLARIPAPVSSSKNQSDIANGQ